MFLVAKRIEDETELVIVINQFATNHPRANFFRVFFETDRDDIQMLVGVAEIRLRFLGDGRAVLRIALEKLIDLEHGAGKFGGGPHLEEVGDRGSLLEFGNVQRGERWMTCSGRSNGLLVSVGRERVQRTHQHDQPQKS